MRRTYFLLPVLFSAVLPRVIDDYSRGRETEFGPEGLSEDGALFLTPYIENNQIEKAQDLATVPPLLENVYSYSGFLTVNKTANSNIFFWLFKSQEAWEDQPLIIWLQGGPGGSSMFGLFAEIGPFYPTKKQKLKRRKYSWNRKFNLVFIDNPVGTGFSFTEMDSGYATDENDVARDLYEALVQLYKLFPNLQNNKLFITGESYAGKYIPAIGYKIYKENKVSNFKIDLGGLMIGNAWTDPINQFSYAAFLNKLGLVDKRTEQKLADQEDNVRAFIKAKMWGKAMETWDDEFDDIMSITGIGSVYDFVNDDVFHGIGDVGTFLNQNETREAIHVGGLKFNNHKNVYEHLEADVMQSVRPWVEELLEAEEFPILFFSGQLDIIVAYPLSVDFYDALSWPRAHEYHTAERCQFKVEEEVAGYYKTAGTLTEVLVRNAGHMVPTTQPKWAYELLERFVTRSDSFKHC